MDKIRNQYFYKVISLLIKSGILIFSFYYIWQKIVEAEKNINISEYLTLSKLSVLTILFLLMLINWSLEAAKWKILIAPLESISFYKSLISVFAGVTASIFTPNRIGEFTGRVFFLEKADKIQATFKSFIGSAAQLFITISAGLISVFAYYINRSNLLVPEGSLTIRIILFSVAIIILATVFLFLVYHFRGRMPVKFRSYVSAFFEIKRKDLFLIVLLSAIRYFVFTFQYYLILKTFNVPVDFKTAFMLIALTFLVTSAIPTFALTEIAVRGASAVYFFSMIGAEPSVVVAASFTVWLINLALPALIGSIFVWKLQFFKDRK